MFGKKIEGYEINMLNKREIYGGARILFFIGIISFMVSLISKDFLIAKFMIVG